MGSVHPSTCVFVFGGGVGGGGGGGAGVRIHVPSRQVPGFASILQGPPSTSIFSILILLGSIPRLK